MSCLPPMTGNGTNTKYKKCDDWEMVYCCFNHIIFLKAMNYTESIRHITMAPATCITSVAHEDKVIVSFKAKGDGSFELRTPGKNKLRMAPQVVETLLETTETSSNNWKADLSKQTVRVIHPLGILLAT